MKKILLIIFSILIISGCTKVEKTDEELKSLIMENLDKISEAIDKKPNCDYVKNRYFRKIVKMREKAVSILIELYYNGDLDEIKSYIAIEAIQKITGCNIFEIYGLTWESPEEFFELWKNNNCFYKEAHSNINNVGDLLDKYSEFSDIVQECKINIPIFKEMIPQGITTMGDHILITAYDSSEQNNSKCYVLNKNGEIENIVTLDTTSHVGSIEYDEVNNLIWIPGNNGSLNIYSAGDFLSSKDVTAKMKYEHLSSGLIYYQDSSKNQIAYLSINNGYLYIGSFSIFNKGCVKQFQILKNDNDEINLNFIKEFRVPTKVQGITFYENEHGKFMILSKSYGRQNSSSLDLYKYDEEIIDYTVSSIVKVSIKLPPMLEQISMKDRLYAIFESNASKYSNCSEKMGSVCLLEVDKVVDKFLMKEETVKKELEENEKREQEKKEKVNKKKKVKKNERK